MERWFRREGEIEYWLRPYIGLVMMPGYRRVMHQDTRLVFDLYWKLLARGYSETQLADYVVRRRWDHDPPASEAVAFAKAVLHLARGQKLRPSPAFNYYFDPDNHPRDWWKE